MQTEQTESLDLIGGPFSVIESDPGVFTSLIRKLGVRGLEVVELLGIEPWETDHLQPHGLIFCYLCTDESDKHLNGGDELDDADVEARAVWFANQLSDDACASQAILNVLLNCPDVDVGEELHHFRVFSREMSPVMRGLTMSNSSFIREAQNSLARPADLRASLFSLAHTVLEAEKTRAKAEAASESAPPSKKRKTASPSKKHDASSSDKLESYHFIGYVPAHGKVWELDGLRASGPLEVGALDEADPPGSWMNVVRPALRMKMEKYLSSGEHIRFNLLAIVDDRYQKASDALEMLKRERTALERRLNEAFPDGWVDKVDPALLESGVETFATSLRPPTDGPVFGQDFGSRKMDKELAILDMPARKLADAWQDCVRNAMSAKMVVEDEVEKSRNANAEHISRTFDYEPFIKEFVASLHTEDLLEQALSNKQGEATQDDAKPTAKGKSRGKAKR